MRRLALAVACAVTVVTTPVVACAHHHARTHTRVAAPKDDPAFASDPAPYIDNDPCGNMTKNTGLVDCPNG
jgi:hypothetical protein